VRVHDGHRGIPRGGTQDVTRPGDGPATLPDRDQAADQGPDHAVAERVGADRADRDAGVVPPPGQLLQGADRRGALALPAERREVVAPDQHGRGGVHRRQVQGSGPGEDLGAGERVDHGRRVRDPVGVAPPQRPEPGVEAGCGLDHPAYPHVARQQPVQAAQQRLDGWVRGAAGRRHEDGLVHVEVRHLAAGVHPGVGPAGAHDGHLGHPQHRRQRGRQLPLHGPQPRLGGPAVEVGAVVGQVDPDPHGATSFHLRPRLSL
jgi:hypothetical protein